MGFAIALLISVAGVSLGTGIPLRLSLTDLLPDNRPSVLDLKAVSEEVGGVGYLVLLVGPMENPAKHLAPTAKLLESHPEIKYIFYEREEYLLRNQMLYMLPKKELRKLTKNAQIVFNRGEGKIIDLGLDDELDRDEMLIEANSYFKKFKEKTEVRRYYLSIDKTYAMLLIKPRFDSEDLGKSSELVTHTQKLLKSHYRGELPFRLVGRYVDKVRDKKQIERDIARTGLISLFGIAIVLIWGLGALRGALVTIGCVLISMGWTLGAAHLLVGQINILTGFLVAILGGLGVEYGIHLIRRYYQETAMGKSHEYALAISYHQVGRALFSAAITSSAAFFVLSFSDFRGFSELGKVAGMGVLSIYFTYMLCFPLIGDYLRKRPRFGRSLEIFGYFPVNSRWKWCFIPLAIVLVIGVSRAEFEYDIERLHDLSEETRRLNHLTNELFGRSLTPAALLAKNGEQAVDLQEWLEDRDFRSIIQQSVTLHSLVPRDVSSRERKLQKLRNAIRTVSPREIRQKVGISKRKINGWLNAPAYKREDLPPQLKDNFGTSGNIVLAYPKENLDHVDSLRRFSNLLREAKQEFKGLKIGSDALVFAEILDHIIEDGKIVMLLFLAGAFFVFWLDFRRFSDALILELQLIFGILLLVGLMGFFGVRFSILNVAMIPAVLAAGVDMGVHVIHRQQEGFCALASARFVAQAVQLSAITTIIGFGALFFAEAGMLKGIAWISVLGQISMYLVCMVFSPILKDMLWRGERKRAGIAQGDSGI